MTAKRRFSIFLLLSVILVTLFLLLLGIGSVSIPVSDILSILSGSEASNPVWEQILIRFRLPKAVMAVLAGIALSIAGLQMQTLFRNPLAGPYVLGLSSGASLGVALLVLSSAILKSRLGLAGIAVGSYSTIIAAITGSALVMLLIMFVASRIQSSVTLLIVGMMFGFATSGLVSILMHFSNPEDIQAYIYWTFGSFRGATVQQLFILGLIIVPVTLFCFFQVKFLNALLLGEDYAKSVGVHVDGIRYKILLSTALLAGAVTAFCGPIAFIGIAIPHLCRSFLKTSDHRILFPGVILVGSIIAMAAELIASIPYSQYSLPLNAVTSIFGAPIVIWVVLKQQRSRIIL